MSIFFTNVDSGVQSSLNQRVGIYSSENRSEGAHNWLYKKMAWATARAVNTEAKRSYSLAVPSGGGIGKSGIYNSFKVDTNSHKILPKPHLDSISISAIGDFGSVRKADIKFTVYQLTDIDLCQPFFDLGADLELDWGWNQSGGAYGKYGKFRGKIFNFSYSVNPAGGFDCTTSAMAEGISALGVTINTSYKIPEKKSDDIKEIDVGTFIGVLKLQAKSLTSKSDNSGSGGIFLVKYPKDFAEISAPKSGEASEAVRVPYVNLFSIFFEINKIIKHVGLDASIKCDGIVTKGLIPKDKEILISSDPTKVIIPGFAKYGELDFGRFGDDGSLVEKGDLSKILISLTWLENAVKEIGESVKVKTLKSAERTIYSLIHKIFDLVYTCSGERFKLTLASDPKKVAKNEKDVELLVVDSNYIDDTDKVKPYKFTAVTQGSIVRSISLTSKVPNEMQTVAYVSNLGNAVLQNGASIGNAIGGRSVPNDTVSEAELKTKLIKIKESLGVKVTTELITELQATMKSLAVHKEHVGKFQTPGIKEAIPFPLNLTITLDGIEGFIFGNAITCNYLPSIYTKSGTNITFTVTKVNHNISGNDWTTTLETVCRITTVPDTMYIFGGTGTDADNSGKSFKDYSMMPNVPEGERGPGAKAFNEYTAAKMNNIKNLSK